MRGLVSNPCRAGAGNALADVVGGVGSVSSHGSASDATRDQGFAAVRLRPLRGSDPQEFERWGDDPEVRRHYLGRSSDLASVRWLPGPLSGAQIGTSRPAARIVRAIEGSEGDLLGWVELRDLNWRRRSGELRICLGRPATWGQGLGTAALKSFLWEAFGVLRLRSVHLRVATWNLRALRAYEKAGFRKEACLVAGRRREDGIDDLWLMSISAARFFGLRERWSDTAGG